MSVINVLFIWQSDDGGEETELECLAGNGHLFADEATAGELATMMPLQVRGAHGAHQVCVALVSVP